MIPAQQFSVDPVYDGAAIVCTLPAQANPFKVVGIHFRFEYDAGIATRTFFIEYVFGQVRTIWYMTHNGGFTFGPGVFANFNGVINGNGSYSFANLPPNEEWVQVGLPDIVLSDSAVVRFGVYTAQADIISNAGLMLQF